MSVPRPTPERSGVEEKAVSELLDPVVEAEALRMALTEAMTRVVRLLAALKQLRKERRTLASVYSNLKQLNLEP